MNTFADLRREYAFLAALTERTDLPESTRACLPGIRNKLDTLWHALEAEYGVHDDWQRDPAMGLIQIERVALPLDEPASLYGVSVPVYSLIVMRVFRAEVHRQTGEIRPVAKVLELKMPESEWGQAIAQSNGGHGTATLIEYLGTAREAFDPQNDPCTHRGDAIGQGFENALDTARTSTRQTLEAILSQLDDKGRLGKRDGEALSRRLKNVLNSTSANLVFHSKQLVQIANERTMELANQIHLRGKGD